MNYGPDSFMTRVYRFTPDRPAIIRQTIINAAIVAVLVCGTTSLMDFALVYLGRDFGTFFRAGFIIPLIIANIAWDLMNMVESQRSQLPVAVVSWLGASFLFAMFGVA